MDSFDSVIREYIDFVNQQVGVYMDALAGFAGHRTRVERQVHRANKPVRSSIDKQGLPVVIWASYEDPSKPDVIHNRIIRAEDYMAANATGGSNEQQHAKAIIIFLYTYWEDEIRPRLATLKNVQRTSIRSNVMGDLRIVRNAILHTKSIIPIDQYQKLKQIQDLFVPEQPILLPYENMQQVFVRIKQTCAALLFEWLKIADAPIKPEELKDVAIQHVSKNSRRHDTSEATDH
ncbi:hypothetical protein [Nitrospira sp. Nam74]